ncbi:unnamed protein product [Brassica rapa subsp. trilocularis]
MGEVGKSSSGSISSHTTIIAPLCHCFQSTSICISSTDANPGRRFFKCEQHGSVEADPELEAIRQRRMQELMAQHGTGKRGNQQNPDQERAQEDAKREADERRQMMLSQILSS